MTRSPSARACEREYGAPMTVPNSSRDPIVGMNLISLHLDARDAREWPFSDLKVMIRFSPSIETPCSTSAFALR